jgi:hypothetical protein
VWELATGRDSRDKNDTETVITGIKFELMKDVKDLPA